MMMNLLEKLSTEDYIRLEDGTGLKHEYHDGWVVAMSGVTEEHDLVASAIRNLLWNCLKKKGCRIYSSDIRVFVPDCNKFVYPDATVVCGESQRHKLPRRTRMVVGKPKCMTRKIKPYRCWGVQ
jgi:Uma2 family endonuclease